MRGHRVTIAARSDAEVRALAAGAIVVRLPGLVREDDRWYEVCAWEDVHEVARAIRGAMGPSTRWYAYVVLSERSEARCDLWSRLRMLDNYAANPFLG